jgi:hypothetical protein
MKYNKKTTEKLPKKNNASDGKKAHNDSIFYKVGKIKYRSWANKVLKEYDIIVYERELVHIGTHHKTELGNLGLTAFDFVKFIVLNFNEVYEGKNSAKILVVNRSEMSHRAIIEIEFSDRKYKIKTASPIKSERLSKLKLLCANAR